MLVDSELALINAQAQAKAHQLAISQANGLSQSFQSLSDQAFAQANRNFSPSGMHSQMLNSSDPMLSQLQTQLLLQEQLRTKTQMMASNPQAVELLRQSLLSGKKD